MVGITHEEAVRVLTSVRNLAELRIEKNAIGSASPISSSDEDAEDEVCIV